MQIHTDKQIDRKTDTQTNRCADKQSDSKMNSQVDEQIDEQTSIYYQRQNQGLSTDTHILIFQSYVRTHTYANTLSIIRTHAYVHKQILKISRRYISSPTSTPSMITVAQLYLVPYLICLLSYTNILSSTNTELYIHTQVHDQHTHSLSLSLSHTHRQTQTPRFLLPCSIQFSIM